MTAAGWRRDPVWAPSWGRKKLKAIVLSGKRRIDIHNRDEIKRLSRAMQPVGSVAAPFLPGPMTAYMGAVMRILPTQMAMEGLLYKILLRKWGTSSMNQASVEMGDAPVKNWKGSNVVINPERSLPTNPDAVIKTERVKYSLLCLPAWLWRDMHHAGKIHGDP